MDNFKIDEKRLSKIIKESIRNTLFGRKDEELDIEKIFHFSQIPTSELYKQYVDYSFDSDCEGFRCLSEAVSSFAQQASNAKTEMMRIYKMKDWQIQILQGSHNVEVIILYAGILKNAKLIKNEMKRLGFFPSLTAWKRRGFMLWKAIKFEPFDQDDMSTEAKQFGVLYHITPSYNHRSIMQNGLLPKSENNMFDYPDRVYVLGGNIDRRNVLFLANQLYEKNRKSNKNNNGSYNLYKIDTTKLGDDIKFYGDPNYGLGYYTKQVIPSDSLSLIQTIQL